MLATPRRFSLTAGSGTGNTALNAFDAALLSSGLGNVNLIRITSILPPGAEHVEDPLIAPGSLVPTAYASISSDRPGDLISAAVAVGIPRDEESFGVIMETSGRYSRAEAEATVTRKIQEAFSMRGMELKETMVRAVELRVDSGHTCAFAGVALWA